jgi:ABC-2 type transport system permease protein
VTAFFGLCRNEWVKLWRHRRVAICLVGAVAFGIAILNALATSHGGSWQDSVRVEIGQLQQLEAQIARASSAGDLPSLPGDATQVFARQLALRQYLLAHDVAPDSWYPLTGAATSVFVTSFPILLLLFAGLSAELLAQERNDETIALLLSRPVSRRAILMAKAVAVLAASLMVVLVGLVLSYVLGGVLHGGWDHVTGSVLVIKDPSLGPVLSNVVLLPGWTYVLLSLGVSLLAVVMAVGFGLLVSTFSRRGGSAIALTIGGLFALPSMAAALGPILHSPAWLHWFFFNQVMPAANLGDRAGPTTGLIGLAVSVAVLVGWAILFYGGAVLVFLRRDEIG